MWPNQSLWIIQMKTTSNRRLPHKSKLKYLNCCSDLPQTLYLGYVTKATFTNVSNKDDLQRKITSNGRWPAMKNDLKWKSTSNIKNEISQQLLVIFPPNSKLRFMWPKQTLQMFQMKTTSNWRWPPMEDDLQYKKGNNSATTGQIFRLSLCEQTKIYICFKWR
jgi:hypothetical protein